MRVLQSETYGISVHPCAHASLTHPLARRAAVSTPLRPHTLGKHRRLGKIQPPLTPAYAQQMIPLNHHVNRLAVLHTAGGLKAAGPGSAIVITNPGNGSAIVMTTGPQGVPMPGDLPARPAGLLSCATAFFTRGVRDGLAEGWDASLC